MHLLRDLIAWASGAPIIGDEASHRRYYTRRALWEKRAHLWWLYPIIGLYTFGHCATNYPVMDMRNWGQSPCETAHRKDNFTTAIQAGTAGLFWPAYWTWEAMDNAA